jgi:hypothetical protein
MLPDSACARDRQLRRKPRGISQQRVVLAEGFVETEQASDVGFSMTDRNVLATIRAAHAGTVLSRKLRAVSMASSIQVLRAQAPAVEREFERSAVLCQAPDQARWQARLPEQQENEHHGGATSLPFPHLPGSVAFSSWPRTEPRRREAAASGQTSAEGLAGGLGFEPRLKDSESSVLPLDDPPICRIRQSGPALYPAEDCA